MECGSDAALRAELETRPALDTAGDAEIGFLGSQPLQAVPCAASAPVPKPES